MCEEFTLKLTPNNCPLYYTVPFYEAEPEHKTTILQNWLQHLLQIHATQRLLRLKMDQLFSFFEWEFCANKRRACWRMVGAFYLDSKKSIYDIHANGNILCAHFIAGYCLLTHWMRVPDACRRSIIENLR